MKYPCLVYRPGHFGPRPEVWFREYTENQKPVKVLESHPLTPDQAKLPFSELMSLFPPPVEAPPPVDVRIATETNGPVKTVTITEIIPPDLSTSD